MHQNKDKRKKNDDRRENKSECQSVETGVWRAACGTWNFAAAGVPYFRTECRNDFLPIQIPVLFAGMLLGPYYGGLIGILVPLFSSVLTGMPPVPKVYFMFVELMAYGIVTGWMIKKTNVYASLLTAMILGRAAYGISLIVGAQLLHIQAPFLNRAAFLSGIVSGVPGMLIQIVILPVLYLTLKRGGLTFER